MNFLRIVIKVSTFDIFKAEWFLQKIFHFSDTPSYNDIFEIGEYSGANFILGVAPMFIIAVFYGIFLIFRALILKYSTSESYRMVRLRSKIADHNIEAICVRFILEGNIDLTIWCFLSINYAVRTKAAWMSFSDVFSNLMGFLTLIPLVAAPIYFYRQAAVLSEKEAKRKE
jgi:hypothetical protein